jgi:hypothetical protein
MCFDAMRSCPEDTRFWQHHAAFFGDALGFQAAMAES